MNLLGLVEDTIYADKYDYEKRIDLFNKYQISVTTVFFVPIFALYKYIMHECTVNPIWWHKDIKFVYGHQHKLLGT